MARFVALIPHYCLLCEQPVERGIDLCAYCEQSLPRNLLACVRCALPLPTAVDVLCSQCALNPPPCVRSIAPFLYREPVSVWIRQFKFRHDWRAGKVLAELVATDISKQALAGALPDLIVPVPLSAWRLFWRGHNQAHALAQMIAKRVRRPLTANLLTRLRHTRAQADLPRSDRSTNVSRAFVASTGVCGKSVALVDDVYTTGATLTSATKALRSAGATEVTWWVAARTP